MFVFFLLVLWPCPRVPDGEDRAYMRPVTAYPALYEDLSRMESDMMYPVIAFLIVSRVRKYQPDLASSFRIAFPSPVVGPHSFQQRHAMSRQSCTLPQEPYILMQTLPPRPKSLGCMA